jgi:hypothetical protein
VASIETNQWMAGDPQSICQKQIKTFGSILWCTKIENYITGPVAKHSDISSHFLQHLRKNAGLTEYVKPISYILQNDFVFICPFYVHVHAINDYGKRKYRSSHSSFRR